MRFRSASRPDVGWLDARLTEILPPHPFVVGQTIDNAIRALRRITKDTPKF